MSSNCCSSSAPPCQLLFRPWTVRVNREPVPRFLAEKCSRQISIQSPFARPVPLRGKDSKPNNPTSFPTHRSARSLVLLPPSSSVSFIHPDTRQTHREIILSLSIPFPLYALPFPVPPL